MLLSEKMRDDIVTFVSSEAWQVIQYRILEVYCSDIGNEIVTALNSSNSDRAQRGVGKINGAKDVIEITERLGEEIKRGKLDVDVALSVIENKRRM